MSPARIWHSQSLYDSQFASFQEPVSSQLYILNSAQDSSLLKLFGSPSCQCRKFTCKHKENTKISQYLKTKTKLNYCQKVQSTDRGSVTPHITSLVRSMKPNPCSSMSAGQKIILRFQHPVIFGNVSNSFAIYCSYRSHHCLEWVCCQLSVDLVITPISLTSFNFCLTLPFNFLKPINYFRNVFTPINQ